MSGFAAAASSSSVVVVVSVPLFPDRAMHIDPSEPPSDGGGVREGRCCIYDWLAADRPSTEAEEEGSLFIHVEGGGGCRKGGDMKEVAAVAVGGGAGGGALLLLLLVILGKAGKRGAVEKEPYPSLVCCTHTHAHSQPVPLSISSFFSPSPPRGVRKSEEKRKRGGGGGGGVRKFLFFTYLLYLLRVVPLCMFSVTAVQTARRRERAKIRYFYCLIDSRRKMAKEI